MLRESAKNEIKNKLKSTLLLLVLFSLTACSTISYYGQSVIGHSRLMLARQSIDEVIKTAEPELKNRLLLAKQLRQFAVDELALPDNGSYSSYVDLKREYPVWTVVATEEFSLTPKSWCYLVIGCASYRGYFNQTKALKYADHLQAQGLETHVSGAIAYSTLGWFADPLLPSMMRYGDTDFAETLFHELAHQRLYINGDSGFNEAFATVVGQEGAKRWLNSYRPDLMSGYRSKIAATQQFNELIAQTKKELEQVYEADNSQQQKRILKQQAFISLRQSYESIKANDWNNKGWFDAWFLGWFTVWFLGWFNTWFLGWFDTWFLGWFTAWFLG